MPYRTYADKLICMVLGGCTYAMLFVFKMHGGKFAGWPGLESDACSVTGHVALVTFHGRCASKQGGHVGSASVETMRGGVWWALGHAF